MTKERREYLEELASEFDIPLCIVIEVAEMLGPTEDHDGLITTLEDYEEFDF